jgi:hypothetical protein
MAQAVSVPLASEGVLASEPAGTDDDAVLAAAADEAEADHASLAALLDWEVTSSSALPLTADAGLLTSTT